MSQKTNLQIAAAVSVAIILTIAAFLGNPAMRPHAVVGRGKGLSGEIRLKHGEKVHAKGQQPVQIFRKELNLRISA